MIGIQSRRDAGSKSNSPRRRPRFQFGLGTLLLVTAMFSVLAAALAGMLRGRFYGSMPPGFFESMAAAAPMAVLVVVSLLRAVVQMLKRRGR